LLVGALLAPVVVLAQPVAAGCALGTRHAGVTAYRSAGMGTTRLALYGDSISYQAWSGLAAVEPGLAVDTFWGRSTAPTVDVLVRDVQRHVPDVVVLAAGTNDITMPDQVAAQVLRAREALPASTRLLWVNTYVETTPGWAAVDAQVAPVPGLEIVNWAGTNLRARGLGPRSPLLADGIHLTCDGAQAWVDLLHRSLRSPAPLLHQAARAGEA